MEKLHKYIESAAKAKIPEIIGIHSMSEDSSVLSIDPILRIYFKLDYRKLMERLGIHLTDEQISLIYTNIPSTHLAPFLVAAIKMNKEKFSNILEKFDFNINKFSDYMFDITYPLIDGLNTYLNRFINIYLPKNMVGKYKYIVISYIIE